MNKMQEVGCLAHAEIIQKGGDIAAHLTELFQNTVDNNFDVPSGAVSYLMLVYGSLERAGLVPQYADEDLNRFMHAGGAVMAAAFTQRYALKDGPWISSRLSAMVGIVNEHRAKLNFVAPVVAKQAPPAPAAPIEVRVVGMPERVTESSVTYDAEGNIKSTKQTEKDADPQIALAWESEA